MINKGKSQYRFKSNPAEQVFAECWEEKNNDSQGRGILDYLLAEDNNSPCGEVTDRDRMVAATVIQWLGSPVGGNFMEDVAIRIIEEAETKLFRIVGQLTHHK